MAAVLATTGTTGHAKVKEPGFRSAVSYQKRGGFGLEGALLLPWRRVKARWSSRFSVLFPAGSARQAC